jgi:hypothetical protein
VEREEKKEFSLQRELSSPLLSVDTDCNFQQFKIRPNLCKYGQTCFCAMRNVHGRGVESSTESLFWKTACRKSHAIKLLSHNKLSIFL